jgi:hypothetical protein
MKNWYDRQHWLIQGLANLLFGVCFFFFFDQLLINNIDWFEEHNTPKQSIQKAIWMGIWFSIILTLAKRSRFFKKHFQNPDESAGN